MKKRKKPLGLWAASLLGIALLALCMLPGASVCAGPLSQKYYVNIIELPYAAEDVACGYDYENKKEFIFFAEYYDDLPWYGGHELYVYHPSTQTLQRMMGRAERLGSTWNAYYCVNSFNQIFRQFFEIPGWERLPGLATDIGRFEYKYGEPAIIGVNSMPQGNDIYQWKFFIENWVTIGGLGTAISYRCVANREGRIYRLDDQNRWWEVGGYQRASDLDVNDYSLNMFIVSSDLRNAEGLGQILFLPGGGNEWMEVCDKYGNPIYAAKIDCGFDYWSRNLFAATRKGRSMLLARKL